MSMRRSPELWPKLWDGLVVLAVILLAVGSGIAVWSGTESHGQLTAVVTADGTEVDRFDLSDSQMEKNYTSRGYTLHVLVLDSEIRVSAADCPTQDCVHTGFIDRAGQSIVCLPARIIIRLEGGTVSDGGPDIVIG